MRRVTLSAFEALALAILLVADVRNAWAICETPQGRLRRLCLETTVPVPDARGTLKERDQSEWGRFLAAMEIGWQDTEQRRLVAIQEQLASDDPSARAAGLSRVEQERPPAEAVVSGLVGQLAEATDERRIAAMRGLALYPDVADQTVAPLLALARDGGQSGPVRTEAFAALGILAPTSATVVDGAIAVLADPATTFSVQRAAIAVLEQAGADAAPARPVLSALLTSPFSAIQVEAARALEHIEGRRVAGARATAGAPNVAAATRSLREPEAAHVKAGAIEELAALGPGRPEATEALLGVIGGRDAYLADMAAAALARIDPTDAGAVEPLVRALGSPSGRVRTEAARTLRVLGPTATPAAPALAEALERATGETDDAEVGHYLDALRAIGPPASQIALPVMMDALAPSSRLLRDRDPFRRGRLAGYLLSDVAQLAPSDDALRIALSALRDPAQWTEGRSGRIYLVAGASRVVAQFGAAGAAAVPSLLAVLDDDFEDDFIDLSQFAKWMSPETSARLEAIRALGAIGPQASAAVPALKQLSRDRDPRAILPIADEGRQALRAIRKKSPRGSRS